MGQLQLILAEVRNGATGQLEVARRTGLPSEVVEAGLASLQLAGLVRQLPLLGSGCAPAGCTACPVTGSCASPGR